RALARQLLWRAGDRRDLSIPGPMRDRRSGIEARHGELVGENQERHVPVDRFARGLRFGADAFHFTRSATSLARNFAIRSISFTGTGAVSGKRIVPLPISYGASSVLKAATRRLLEG